VPAPTVVGGFAEMHEEATKVMHAEKAPAAALDDLLADAAFRTGTSVQGYVIETNDLEHLAIPGELLTPGPMRVAVGITHHRAPGAAWGQYVVFVVLVGADATTPRTTPTTVASLRQKPQAAPSVTLVTAPAEASTSRL
jgi:hypothetical protein